MMGIHMVETCTATNCSSIPAVHAPVNMWQHEGEALQ